MCSKNLGAYYYAMAWSSAEKEEFGNPHMTTNAASIDKIIARKDTRKEIVSLLKAFRDKTENVANPKKAQYDPALMSRL